MSRFFSILPRSQHLQWGVGQRATSAIAHHPHTKNNVSQKLESTVPLEGIEPSTSALGLLHSIL